MMQLETVTQFGTVAGLLTALFTLTTAVLGLVLVSVGRKAKTQIEQVHTIVNQQRTDMLRFQKVLINALVAHGIDIPEDQSRLDDQPDAGKVGR